HPTTSHTHPLSLHDALPISLLEPSQAMIRSTGRTGRKRRGRVLFCFVSALLTLMVPLQRAWPQSGSGASGNLLVNGSFEGPTYTDRKSTRLNSSHVSISYAV